MRILFFGAHPDDVERHCGGLIALLAELGYEVWIIALSAGEKGTHGTPRVRRQESKRAATILGACSRVLSLPDTKIAATSKNRQIIVSIIRELRPDIVFAQYHFTNSAVYGVHAHPDHAAAGLLVKEALFFSTIRKYANGKTHRVTRLYYYMLPPDVRPNILVPISDAHMEKAFCAIQAHASQLPRNAKDRGALLQRLRSFRLNTDRDAGVHLPKGYMYAEKYVASSPLVISKDTISSLFV